MDGGHGESGAHHPRQEAHEGTLPRQEDEAQPDALEHLHDELHGRVLRHADGDLAHGGSLSGTHGREIEARRRDTHLVHPGAEADPWSTIRRVFSSRIVRQRRRRQPVELMTAPSVELDVRAKRMRSTERLGVWNEDLRPPLRLRSGCEEARRAGRNFSDVAEVVCGCGERESITAKRRGKPKDGAYSALPTALRGRCSPR